MPLKFGFVIVVFLIGSYALPIKDDVSIFFNHIDPSARFLGSTIAGRIPYMVALTTGVSITTLSCGASLVTTRHVLTAAHCVQNVRTKEGTLFRSLRGHVGTDRYATGGIWFVFAGFIIHPHYDYILLKNDLAFLITSTNVALSDTVYLAALNFDFINAGVAATVTGWGVTSTGSFSQVLLQLSGTVIEGNQCVNWVAKRSQEIFYGDSPSVNPELEICTFNAAGRGLCNGDSGSPLVLADTNQQIGIVSWGLPCARNAPDVFVRLSAYRYFIEQSLKNGYFNTNN